MGIMYVLSSRLPDQIEHAKEYDGAINPPRKAQGFLFGDTIVGQLVIRHFRRLVIVIALAAGCDRARVQAAREGGGNGAG